MVKHFELINFDFSFATSTTESLSCPNCGFLVHHPAPLLTLPKSLIFIGCGTLVYLNYFKPNKLRSALIEIQNILQYCGNSISSMLNPIVSTETTLTMTTEDLILSGTSLRKPMTSNGNTHHYQRSVSIPSSTLNSDSRRSIILGSRLSSYNQSVRFDPLPSCTSMDDTVSNCSLYERRQSEGELTLPSLEWDSGDTALAYYNDDDDNSIIDEGENDDSFHHFGGKKQTFLYNVKYNGIIDTEILSQIIFNKDYEFRDSIYDRIKLKKHLASLRHQLMISSKNYSYHNRNGGNINSTSYRSNRDSAFFEE